MRGRFLTTATVGFAVLAMGGHGEAREAAVDAAVVSSAVLGGTGLDSANAVAVDRNGNIYVAGETASADFPVLGSSRAFAGVSDAFVAKLDPTGRVLLYSTFLGGSEADVASGIAVDAAGNAWVAGETLSPDFPTTSDALRRDPAGASDAFLAKLDPSGNAVLYATRIGGAGFDRANALAVGVGDNVAVAGRTGSSDFPTTAGAAQTFFRGGDFDAFVSRFDSSGQLTSSTFLGGSENDAAFGVALDGGAVWIAGGTRSPDFPATTGAFQSSNFATDAFATKLDSAGGFVYSTFLGGSFVDRANAISVDSLGHAFVAGQAGSPDFPMASPVQAASGGGANDGFLAELDPARAGDASLLFSTYLGGSGDDRSSGVAIAGGELFFAGQTSSADFPLLGFTPPSGGGGASDAFVARLQLAGAPRLSFSALVGGSGDDRAFAVAANPAGEAILAGRTDSAGFPSGAVRVGPGGSTDAFVVRIGEGGAGSVAAIPMLSPALLALLAAALAAVGLVSLRR